MTKIWMMEEDSGAAVRTDDEGVAREAYLRALIEQGWSTEEARRAVDRAEATVGFYRWNVCHPERNCYAGLQHRPGHLEGARGPGRGVWRGIYLVRP